jgi:hypothetical protein
LQLVLSDPTVTPRETLTPSETLALRFIHDRRDIPFLSLMAVLSATVLPTGVALFWPGGFAWWLAVGHTALVVYFIGPFVLMLHNTSHRSLFRRRWAWMNWIIPWVIGPFFGESPETYFAHHVGMHHAENNLAADLSSTLPYKRDSAAAFARYFLSFFFAGLLQLTRYFARRRRYRLMFRCLVGELSFFALVLDASVINWRAALVVFVLPFVVVRFAMMAGNWGQHAFVDATSPENSYRNSITCINTSYNRRCFNDGYHIGHHVRSTRHWTEMPADFLGSLETYSAEGAIVFREIDFFGVWLCLMLKRYDWLARRFVHLGSDPRPDHEIVALLRSRTQWTISRDGR